MQITAPNRKFNTQQPVSHSSDHHIFPIQIKKAISTKAQIDSKAVFKSISPLSSQLTRLVDACGDCV